MSNYEFTEPQNAIFLKLVNSMRAYGVISVIIGGILIYSGISLALGGASNVVAASRAGQGIAAFLVGIIWWTSSTGFQSVTTTKGDDIRHLMEGIKTLSTGFLFILCFAILRVALQGMTAANNVMTFTSPGF
jgi:hypothetical protein